MPHGFVHLRLHTEYSLSDSVVRVPELIAPFALSHDISSSGYKKCVTLS